METSFPILNLKMSIYQSQLRINATSIRTLILLFSKSVSVQKFIEIRMCTLFFIAIPILTSILTLTSVVIPQFDWKAISN